MGDTEARHWSPSRVLGRAAEAWANSIQRPNRAAQETNSGWKESAIDVDCAINPAFMTPRRP